MNKLGMMIFIILFLGNTMQLGMNALQEGANPIYAAYFHDTSCQACTGAYLSLIYLQDKYPQLVIEEFDSSAHAAIGEWLSRRSGRGALQTSALFIENQAWIGDKEIQAALIEPVLKRLTPAGALNSWKPLEKREKMLSLILQFYPNRWLMSGAAGILDGLSPLLFALAIWVILRYQKFRKDYFCAVGIILLASIILTGFTIQLHFFQFNQLTYNLLIHISRWGYVFGAGWCLLSAILFLRSSICIHNGQGNVEKGTSTSTQSKGIIWKPLLRLALIFLVGVGITLLRFSFQEQLNLSTMSYISTLLSQNSPDLGQSLIYCLLFTSPTLACLITLYPVIMKMILDQPLFFGISPRLSVAVILLVFTFWSLFSVFS